MEIDVLITGMGAVSCRGHGVKSLWEYLLHGYESPVRFPYPAGDCAAASPFYPVKTDPGGGTEQSGASDGKAVAWSVWSAKEALKDSGLEVTEDLKAGMVLGTNMGISDLLERALDGGPSSPEKPVFLYNLAPKVARALGLEGPIRTVSTACSAGLYSVCLGYELIKSGRADVVLAGGAESAATVYQTCFQRLGALAAEACKPFDTERNGTVTSEGAAVLVLESSEHFRNRGGKHCYAVVKGYGWSCDGHHPVSPEPDGRQAGEAMRRALRMAGCGPGDIDVMIPHGTGTMQNDLSESRAIRSVFGEHADRLLAAAIKSKIGHAIGAAGAFSCVAGAMVLDTQCCPVTANLKAQDPECPLTFATSSPVTGDIGHVMVNAYAFGGNNATVILGRSPCMG